MSKSSMQASETENSGRERSAPLSNEVMQELREIQNIIHAKSPESTLVSSLAIAKMVVEAMNRGENVLIQDTKGKAHRILFPGLTS